MGWLHRWVLHEQGQSLSHPQQPLAPCNSARQPMLQLHMPSRLLKEPPWKAALARAFYLLSCTGTLRSILKDMSLDVNNLDHGSIAYPVQGDNAVSLGAEPLCLGVLH